MSTTTLVAATVAVGLMAGVYAAFSLSVMPGLAETDDATFVAAFGEIDRAILNPIFLSLFVGAALLTGAAAMTAQRRALPIAALVLYGVTMAVTARVNVPANDALRAAGPPAQIADLAAVRAEFDPDRWLLFNHVRFLLSAAAFTVLAVALAQDR